MRPSHRTATPPVVRKRNIRRTFSWLPHHAMPQDWQRPYSVPQRARMYDGFATMLSRHDKSARGLKVLLPGSGDSRLGTIKERAACEPATTQGRRFGTFPRDHNRGIARMATVFPRLMTGRGR
jgi:hypothetical protein